MVHAAQQRHRIHEGNRKSPPCRDRTAMSSHTEGGPQPLPGDLPGAGEGLWLRQSLKQTWSGGAVTARFTLEQRILICRVLGVIGPSSCGPSLVGVNPWPGSEVSQLASS